MTKEISVEADPTEINVESGDEPTESTITATVKEDGQPKSGEDVAITTNLGTVTAVTDNLDGTYTCKLSSTESGDATVTAKVDDIEKQVLVDVGGSGGGTQGG